MPPERKTGAAPSAAECAAAAEGLHRELAAVYDILETHIAAGAWSEAAALVPRLQAIEAALRPLADARRTASPAETALWAGVDALAIDLGRRKEAALRVTRAAHAATGARLADLHATRTRAAQYRVAPDVAVFASRRA